MLMSRHQNPGQNRDKKNSKKYDGDVEVTLHCMCHKYFERTTPPGLHGTPVSQFIVTFPGHSNSPDVYSQNPLIMQQEGMDPS
jgi:hypothetical protein